MSVELRTGAAVGSSGCRAPAPLERALTLRERCALAEPTAAAIDAAQAGIARWRCEPAFGSAIALEDRLAAEGIDFVTFAAILAGETRPPALPAWWRELEAAYSGVAPCRPGAPGAAPVTGFLNVVRPLTDRARRRLRVQLADLASAAGGPSFDAAALEEQLIAPLGERLLWMLGRTLALELQVASLRGELAGDTATERFGCFAERLRDPRTTRALFDEYPVLAREITEAIERWREVSAELIARLAEDWPQIRTTIFAGRDPGPLVAVGGSAGDAHRGGQSVRILSFASGARLVYKPRSLAVDRHFQELLGWLNDNGWRPAFRLLAVLDRGSHGWTEFATREPCSSADGVERFYARLGGQLALLYALEATDFHHENLIAAADQPILPDLEALFQPRVGGLDLRRADEAAWTALNHSVLRVGLLPQWQGGGDAQIDVSGIGSTEGTLTPYPVPRWEAEGTDEMRLARRRLVMGGSDNRPTVADAQVDASAYTGAIVDGFVRMYRLLLTCRDDLLEEDGPIASFADDDVRVLLRPTRTYATMQRESFHPDVLRDALDRDRLLDRLWLVADSCPPVTAAVPFERADLLRGDIPLFTTHPSSRDLQAGDGSVIAGFFDEPSIAQVRGRFARLSEDDLVQQTWFIRASLSTVAGTQQQASPRRLLESGTAPTREQLIDAAQAVGDRLAELALRGERDVSWIGLSIAGASRWTLTPLGIDLYDGLPGVALFLARLGALTGERRHSELARAAVATLRRQVDLRRSSFASVGAYDGWGGIIYALTHLGVLWDDGVLLDEASEIADGLPPLIDRDESFDVVSGAAGAAAALVCLHRVVPSTRALETAVRAGDRVLAGGAELPGGIGWHRDSAGGAALSGFSHGAAGIAWALLRLAAASGEERFASAARRAIGFERTLFSERQGNWRDLRREVAGEEHFQTSWCHGAVGIGLARLLDRERLDDAADGEIAAALQATLGQGLSESHTLCHGSLGNLELLLAAAGRLDAQRWRPHADRWTASILDDIERYRWYCGTSQGIESPGLMTGLAGIGYGLLRLADPADVPSVLTLEPAQP